jgi:hypothetical protein
MHAVPTRKPEANLIKKLKDENRHLRDAALSLSLTLIRNAALHTVKEASNGHVENLIRLSEECFRSARLSGLKQPIAEGLEAAGHELMAKAVEIETRLQRGRRDD